jgi:hypothetical protein
VMPTIFSERLMFVETGTDSVRTSVVVPFNVDPVLPAKGRSSLQRARRGDPP